MEPLHECLLDICHMCGLGASYPRHGFFFWVDPYVQMIPNRFEDLHDTQT